MNSTALADQKSFVLPLLPPERNLETPTVLKATIGASRALAELKGKMESLPNQSILFNSVILQEAKASSEIDTVLTTNDKIFMAMSANDKQTDSHTKEVLRYRQALWLGHQLLQNGSINTSLLVLLMQMIKENKDGIRSNSGRGLSVRQPEGEEQIRRLLENLMEYLNTEDGTDPLIKMAVIYYQFEAIRPFNECNGRTGRILSILYLLGQQLLHQPVLYLSSHFIGHKSDYYRLLHEVRENEAWEPWILFFLKAVEDASIKAMNRISEIQSLLDAVTEEAKVKLPARVYSKELIELLFEQPYCKVKFLVSRGLAKRQTAAVYLKELEKIGILESKQVGREVLYINKPLYELFVQ